KIGLFVMSTPAMAGGALLKSVAANAERLGAATLWVPEHVVLLDKYASKYPYSQDGVLPAPTNAPIFDPFIALTCMAGATSKIRLATGICLVPEHNPVVLAKVVATLDCLSGGRALLGVGIGWLEEEFQAIGIPWARRARRTRECIDAMRALWRDEVSSYRGEFVSFDGVRSNPKPVRGASLPVFFGGESEPALKRVADYGNGWVGFNLTPAEAADKVSRIEVLLKANGRKRSDVEIAVSPYTKTVSPDDLKRYRDAGVDEVVLVSLRPPREEAETVKQLEQLARDWIEPAAKL
ncbi:MAG TPA: LLM class F420-dependent oxidoreductase, partial [Candidatus Acidoferrales bacterium]|nr:LLM class F420-dependent oxidoreductase [Candidatus Acidoferrales bacterium]